MPARRTAEVAALATSTDTSTGADPAPAVITPTGDPWLDHTDAVLRYLVALHQAGRGQQVASLGSRTATVDEVVTELRPEVEQTRDRFFSSLRDDDSVIGAIAVNAQLGAAECELLAIAIGCEIDIRRQHVLGHLHDDPNRTRLSMQTVGWMLGGLGRVPAAIGPDSRVRRAALLEVLHGDPWAQQAIVVPDAVVWAVLGDAALDPDLPHGVRAVDADGDGSGERLVVVTGPDRVRRRQAAVDATAGTSFLVVSPPVEDRGWAALVREATLSGRGVVVELDGPLSADGRRWIERADHLPWAVTSSTDLPIPDLPDRPFVEIEAPAVPVSDEEWTEAFGPGTPRGHRLSAQQVELVRKVHDPRHGDIDRSVRRLLAGPMEAQAQRIRPRHSWGDLVLDPAQVDQLHGIVARYRLANQVFDRWGFGAVATRGLVSLFSGPSGTGKTLAAEIVASELGLDMFKLDLSAVVSKYIGETEKNLDKVFDAAGMGNVVLFFDEADSMFGKRSEVKDAHDRYANLEVSYLLQRIEAFDGVVVLATNYEKNIDDAFLRRIHARIAFKLPEQQERLAIWQRHLPSAAPLDEIDLDWLSNGFELSGGQIRNAAVHGAFLAAAGGRSIGMADLVRGVAQEIRKAGRLLRPDEFGEWYVHVGG